MISILVLTCNKPHLLAQCFDNVLARTSALTTEIVVWNNGSTDEETRPFLDAITDRRVRVVHYPKNIAQSAYARAALLSTGSHIVELDDDITEAPPEWDRALFDAYERLPRIGFLSCSLVDDEHDPAARAMYGRRSHLYRIETVDGIRLRRGPVGGGCAMISRALLDRVGGFPTRRDGGFFLEDEMLVRHVIKAGYEAAYLEDTKVRHCGGPYYAAFFSESKKRYWLKARRSQAKRTAVKKALLRTPLISQLNKRYCWFGPV